MSSPVHPQHQGDIAVLVIDNRRSTRCQGP